MSSKITGLTNDAAPSLDDLLVSVNDPSGTPGNRKVAVNALAQIVGYPIQGRLTTESGVAVSTSDRTSQATIYFTPYNGNLVSLYTSSAWKLYTFTEKSLALSGLTSGKNYDVFLYDNAGTLTLELSAAWASDTARTDAVTTQDGIVVKSGATSRRHIGTIRSTAATTTEDSAAKRFVWNRYNQVPKIMKGATETADSWTYTTATFRQANNNVANQLDYVVGDATVPVQVRAEAVAINSNVGVSMSVGVGVDNTTTQGAQIIMGNTTSAATQGTQMSALYVGYPGLGRHFLAWLEFSAATGTTTWLGDNALPTRFQSGISGTFLG